MTFNRQLFTFEKPIAANYDTPAGVSCIQVYYPDDIEHLHVLQGLMAALTKPEFWDGSEADSDYRAYLWEVAYQTTDWSNCQPMANSEQGRLTLWHRFSIVTTGNALATTIETTQPFNYTVRQTPGANGDVFYQYAWLRAGNYSINALGIRITDQGQLSVIAEYQADMSQVTALSAADFYGSTLYNFVQSGTFTLTKSGLYKILGKCPGKNASSSGYNLRLTCIEIVRTS